MNMRKNPSSVSQKFFQLLLRAFPFDFRTNYGPEMEDVFHDQRREVEERGGIMGFFKLWAETISGMFRTAPREHWDIFRQDCAYAFRVLRSNKGFTAIAVLTLALGIGANTAVVSWNYFDMFGVKPILGRAFVPKDDEIGAPAVLVLSNEYWRDKFGADPKVIGKTFEMNDKVHTVVGVLPPIPQYPLKTDVYMPTSACPY